ncbi:hypothetical protein MD537_16970 [Flavihumibacter sediminis]|nr:hypothetical protein [Flavihumibacter sediminis]
MKTALTKFRDDTTLLIQGIKGKFDEQGKLTDNETHKRLTSFTTALFDLVQNR